MGRLPRDPVGGDAHVVLVCLSVSRSLSLSLSLCVCASISARACLTH